jgi:mRNA interferase MazF
MKRHEIHWCRLDPIEGSEMAKTRPCVIVSRDELNAHLSTVVVCPVTSSLHPQWRTRLPIRCAGRIAEVCPDQIRTVSKSRLGPKIGKLAPKKSAELTRLLTELYGEG